ncbi:MAG: bifunctional oligoribonuclease/PAP phosphatase NrnA [Lachnospiraceae bacterium]|nr:bifunctional oligoribonuclease/PAP phosphatase NrnA [Lachnospiraceae bacterium]
MEVCKGANRIGISAHIRPDGDAVGSCLALYHYLKHCMPEAYVKVFLENPPACFSKMKGIEDIDSQFPEQEPFDVFFVLDVAKDQERLGEATKYFEQAKKTVNIDHHISNARGSGDVNYVLPEAAATCQVLFELMDQQWMNAKVAEALYVGIIHDCGVFQYSNTTPRTLEVAANLVSYGFNFSQLIEETFYEKTYLQNQLLGRALMESIRFMEGRCIVSCVDRKTMEFYGATSADLDGIVNQLRNTKGVDCAVFMYEISPMTFKVSLRSNEKLDVSKVAGFFGGGGHVRAAGCTLNGTFHDVINNVSAQIEKWIQ